MPKRLNESQLQGFQNPKTPYHTLLKSKDTLQDKINFYASTQKTKQNQAYQPFQNLKEATSTLAASSLKPWILLFQSNSIQTLIKSKETYLLSTKVLQSNKNHQQKVLKSSRVS